MDIVGDIPLRFRTGHGALNSALLHEGRAPRRVAVFRALQLGDMLCAVPALRAIRAAFPFAEIVLIGLPWAQSFCDRFDAYIDEFIGFPGVPELPEQVTHGDAALNAFYRIARHHRFDLAFQLHGSGEITNGIVANLGAQMSAGFHPPHRGRPGELFMPWPEHLPEIHRYLALLDHLGLPLRGDHLEFPLRAYDQVEGARLMHEHGLVPGHYVCLHTGARMATRRWPVERYAEVAAALTQRGATLVLTGTADELPLRDAFFAALPARSPNGRIVDLVGTTALGALAVIVRDARLLICNDTGISHVAAALATPSIVVACGSDTQRWAPLDTQRHVVIARDMPCRPCMHQHCPIGHDCARAISADDVLLRVDAIVPEGFHARH